MSDVERVCWENAERRRREAQERATEDWQAQALEDRKKEYGYFRIQAKAMRIGRMAIVLESAVLFLMGLSGWAVTGLTGAALFCYLEIGFREDMHHGNG